MRGSGGPADISGLKIDHSQLIYIVQSRSIIDTVTMFKSILVKLYGWSWAKPVHLAPLAFNSALHLCLRVAA